MNTKASLKKNWEATPEAFEKLLKWLDPDRERAGEKYELIRCKLIKLFKWRNCRPAAEYADITINRVTRRISENLEIHAEKPYSFFHGTALNVAREFWRGEQKFRCESVEKFPWLESPEKDPEQKIKDDSRKTSKRKKIECMNECIARLSKEKRELLRAYHARPAGEKISAMENRKILARKFGLNLNVLRIRVCRIRKSVRECAKKCLRKKI